MNEVAADAWYFTEGGERRGPVSFAELRGKVAEGGLNPRLDMVWKTGMEAWKPSGEIDGLFERAGVPAVEAVAPAAAPPPVAKAAPAPVSQPVVRTAAGHDEDPYAPPGEDVMEQLRKAKWPGVGRMGFLFMVVVFPAIWNIGLSVLAPEIDKNLIGMLLLVGLLVPVVISIMVTLQRFLNLGMSRWWFFGQLVPLLNLWLGYRLMACPAGYRYHKRMDGAGIALAMLYWLGILVSVFFFVVFVAMVVGAAGNPEQQQRIQEFLQNLQAQAASEVPAPAPQQ